MKTYSELNIHQRINLKGNRENKKNFYGSSWNNTGIRLLQMAWDEQVPENDYTTERLNQFRGTLHKQIYQ